MLKLSGRSHKKVILHVADSQDPQITKCKSKEGVTKHRCKGAERRAAVKKLHFQSSRPSVTNNGRWSKTTLFPQLTSTQCSAYSVLPEAKDFLQNMISELNQAIKQHQQLVKASNRLFDKFMDIQHQLKWVNQDGTTEKMGTGKSGCFPLSSISEMQFFENALKSPAFRASIEQKLTAFRDDVSKLLRFTISNQLAVKYNWIGSEKKRSLRSTALGQLILKMALPDDPSKVQVACVTQTVVRWLKNAKDRDGGRRRRVKKAVDL